MTARWPVALAAVVVVLAAAPALAEDGIYIGGSFGQTSLKIDDLELDADAFNYSASDTSYKIFAGYRFMGFLAVEASYIDFGSLSDSVGSDTDSVELETDLTGFDAVAMGMLPLGIADVFVKAGFVSWSSDIRAAYGEIIDLDSDSGTDLVYGLGAQVRFGGLAVRAELEYFDVADADSLYLLSVGASFTF
jgi:OOP family OmpA-OmpF porin